MRISTGTAAYITAVFSGSGYTEPTKAQALLCTLLDCHRTHREALGIQPGDFGTVFRGVMGRVALRRAISDLEQLDPLYVNPGLLEVDWNKLSVDRQMAIHSLLAFFDDFKGKCASNPSLGAIFNQKTGGGFVRPSRTRQTNLREQALSFFGSESKGAPKGWEAAPEAAETSTFEQRRTRAAELNQLVFTVKQLRTADPIKTPEIISALEDQFDDVLPKAQERLLDKYAYSGISTVRVIAILTAVQGYLQDRVKNGSVPQEAVLTSEAGFSFPTLAA